MSTKKPVQQTDCPRDNQTGPSHINLVNILLILVALLLGVLIQQNMTSIHDRQIETEFQEFKTDLKKLFDELRTEVREKKEKRPLVNEEAPSQRVGEGRVEDLKEVKTGLGDKPLVIDSKSILREVEADRARKEEVILKEKKMKEKKMKEKAKEKKSGPVGEAKEFKATGISRMKPKKMWIPIANR